MPRRNSLYLRRELGHRAARLRPTTSSLNTEALYASAESDRQEIFSRSTYQQEEEYAHEEKAQWEGESQRMTEFDKLVADINAAFAMNEQCREKSFSETEMEQATIYGENQAFREKVFTGSQSRHTASFQQEQDARDLRSKWYHKIRNDHFRVGRQAREDACRKLEVALSEQCDEIIRTQEESFVANERRRDNIVAKLLEEGGNTTFNMFPTNSRPDVKATMYRDLHMPKFEQQVSNGDDASGHRSERSLSRESSTHSLDPVIVPPSRAPSRYSSLPSPISPTPIVSQSPVYAPEDFRIPPGGAISEIHASTLRTTPESPRPSSVVQAAAEKDETLVSFTRLRSSTNSASSKHSIVETDSVLLSPSQVMDTVHTNTTSTSRHSFLGRILFHRKSSQTEDSATNLEKAIRRRFEELFRSTQEERQFAFTLEQERLESRFAQAEAVRDRAEDARDTIFMWQMDGFEEKFRLMMSTHEQQFGGRELIRNKIETRRDGLHQGAEDNCSQIFNQVLSRIDNQFSAEVNLEDDFTEYLKDTIRRLDRKHRVLLLGVRDRHRVQYEKSQNHRDVRLRTNLSDGTASAAHPVKSAFKKGKSSSTISEPHTSRHHIRPRFSVGEPDFAARMPASRPAWRSATRRPRAGSNLPPTGFHPAVLLRGTGIQEPLPIPSVGSNSHHSVYKVEKPWHTPQTVSTFQRECQREFRRSQIQRELAFISDLQRRGHPFKVNEIRRQLGFERKQREKKASFSEQGRKHEMSFREAQAARWERFRIGKSARELGFRTAESEREAGFEAAQKKREKLYHSKQEDLRKLCFESERERLSDLETWASRLLLGRKREQSIVYEAEEAHRERRFETSLRLSRVVERADQDSGKF
ncbi:hypothetical protein Hypma_010995 [Hypsizygus marmoreus]|uniref:Uncharacterized protein n=1 Tax=Hypsizygus marmoreus TaxID=39966 RepID=A0A369JL02_HYPMA|nr:hypothetical protein Hypma_010995 [Hypsizygus marmoreus]